MKTKYPRAEAIVVATEIVGLLQPFCYRIAVVGSLRRGLPVVSDVEILLVPKSATRPADLFNTQSIDIAAEEIDRLVGIGMLSKRPNVNGHFCWGKSNKLAIHKRSGISVDLFSTSEAHWFVSLVIRTGPGPFNIKLIESASRQGLKLHAYASDSGFTDKNGDDLPCPNEKTVFDLCGMRYLEPKDRLP